MVSVWVLKFEVLTKTRTFGIVNIDWRICRLWSSLCPESGTTRDVVK
jgi:hypothetical protein